MKIHIRLHGHLRDQLPAIQKGRAEIELADGGTVEDLLANLNLSRRVEVAINEEIVDNRTQIINLQDQVHIFSAISGGVD